MFIAPPLVQLDPSYSSVVVSAGYAPKIKPAVNVPAEPKAARAPPTLVSSDQDVPLYSSTFQTTEGVFPAAATAVVGPPKPPIKYLAVPKVPPLDHAAAVIAFDDELYSSVNKYLAVPGPA